MSDEPHDDNQEVPAAADRRPVALGIGLALGAIALSAYAYAARVPAGQTATYLAPAGHMLLKSLIGVCVAAAALFVLARRAVVGRPATALAAALAATTAAIAAYALLGTAPNAVTLLISGPGARPVIAIAQASWIVLTCAALALVAGTAAAAIPASSKKTRATIASLAVTGVAMAVVVGIAITSFSGIGVSSAMTTPRVPIPEVPTSVGTNAAYTMNLATRVILPAGPGFVATTDDTVVSYDGSTGAQRWRFPLTNLPARCEYQSIHSTGITADSVVVVQCNRPPNDAGPEDAHRTSDANGSAFLVGLDATTGQQLWLNDDDWHLQGRLNAGNQALAALNANQMAALDPHTGKPLWSRDRADRRECRRKYDAIGTKIVFLDMCAAVLHVYDNDSDALLDVTKQPGYPDDQPEPTIVAIDDGVVVAGAASAYSGGNILVSIDTETMHAQRISIDHPRIAAAAADMFLIPGPVHEADFDSNAHTVTLLSTAKQNLIHVTGLDMYYQFDDYRWARVGDSFVTNTGYQGNFDVKLAIVSPNGGDPVVRPNPCGEPGGVIPVPGAVLALCANYTSQGGISGYDIVGLR